MKKLIVKLLGIAGTLWDFIRPILTGRVASTLTAVAPIALRVVASLAESNIEGDEKRRIALGEIKQELIRQGITAGADIVNTAIELALQNIRATQK